MTSSQPPEQLRDNATSQQTLHENSNSSTVRVFKTFDDMPLHRDLLRGVFSIGFENPSPIQARAIVPVLQGGDVMAQAPSGTGKTGAFSIGLLQRLDFRKGDAVQALVLSPTRELAQQTHDVLSQLGTYVQDQRPPLRDGRAAHHYPFCQLFVGGTAVKYDIERLLQRCTTVAVGTPGRLQDVIRRGALRTDSIRVVVLDEADEMLSQGFCEQIVGVFKYLPKDVQVALFSATMPPEVLELSCKFMRQPTRILLPKERLTLDGIQQCKIIAVPEEALVQQQQHNRHHSRGSSATTAAPSATLMRQADVLEYRLMVVCDLYERLAIAQSVIFVNTRQMCEHVSAHLNARHHTVSALHADLSKQEREKVMATFRSGASRVLVTTDIVARGIDVQHVNVVINFELPQSVETYLHRIGRCGRYGRKGVAINLVATPADASTLQRIEGHYKIRIDELMDDFDQSFGGE